jgi:membrane peptidoglycan carboxypeptidase
MIKLVGTLVITGVLAAGVLLPFVGGAGLAAKHEADNFLSKTCHLTETPPPEKTQVYASDNKTLVATIFKQDRQPITLAQVPKSLQDALVATEDRRFYSHHGVDMRGLIRSAINTSSGDTQGGSTLTMQYVKQIRYYQAGDNKKKQEEAIAQNINRKIEDAKCALYIENTEHESKGKILENYLNIAFFGENSYGIETAAETYFNKTTSQLTLPESAMLVGLLRAPTQYDPFIDQDAARLRRNQVLQNLVSVGKLSQAQADKYKATPVSLATTAPPPLQEGCDNAPTAITNVGFFCKYAVNWLLTHNIVTDAQLETGGLRIVTTLDANLQNSMQRKIAKALSSKADMSAVMPVVDPHTGNILAMASSKNYGTGKNNSTTLPIFTSYTAEGASTYKLFPLLTALSTGVPEDFQLQTPVAGSKYNWKQCPNNGDVTNSDASENFVPGANDTMLDATAKSSNTFFTGIGDDLFQCNLVPIIDMARSLGMKSFSQPSDEKGVTVADSILKYSSVKRLVLGDIATSPLELTSAYAAIANDGKYNAPVPIKSVTDSKNRVINVPRTPGHRVVTAQVARTAIDILTHDTKTPGTSAVPFESWYADNHSLVSGKTGTAPGTDPKTHKDDKNGALWFVGMTPSLVATTALINLDSPSNPASDLPGVTKPEDTAFGAYAAGIWLKALTPTLDKRTWTWPSAEAVNGDTVPDLTGMTLDDAKQALKDKHLKLSIFGGAEGPGCASKVIYGSVAYYGPTIAPRGATITVCTSTGTEQTLYHKPPPPPKKTKTPSSGASGSGSGHAGGGTGTGSAGTGGGGRGGGNSHGPNPPNPTH